MGWPLVTCSGGAQAGDTPTPTPCWPSWVDTEMPKSVRAARPNSVKRMLAGLMSRCRTPIRWADSTAPAIWIVISSALGTG